MDALSSISGLATGIDFRSLVDQIIEVESERLNYLRTGITRSQSKQDAWGEVRTLLNTLGDATRALSTRSGINAFLTSVQGANAGILEVVAGEGASTGSHTVRVIEQARRESLGSELFTSRTAALGFEGRFMVGGAVVEVAASDSLEDIASAINATNTGSDASGVTASVLGVGGASRLVLNAVGTGAEGVDVRDVSGVLGTLGFLDGTTELKHRTSGGFTSDSVADATAALGTLMGFTGGAPSGTVTLGAGASAFTVALDLSSQSLEDVRDAINAAASSAGAAMRASIETTGDESRLVVDGSAAAVDDGGVLQALGVLAGGRGAVSQRLEGAVLTTDGAGTPATAATLLTDLFDGPANAGVTAGDTILFEGRRHDGTLFTYEHTVQAGDTLGSLAALLEGADGFDGAATVEVSAEGRLTILATEGGSSRLALSAFAGNEGGGLLDLGTFDIVDEGRNRQLADGADALVEVDGFLVSSSTNEISDVLPGISITLRGAAPGEVLQVDVTRDVTTATDAVRAFVDAYNALAAFVDAGAGVIGTSRPPLAGDAVLRGIRSQIRATFETVLVGGTPGSPRRLSDIGIEITRQGTYSFDATAVENALRTDASAVLRLLGGASSASSSALRVVGSSATTTAGTYEVVVTQAAARAEVLSSGFGGSYVDDGTPDVLTITDAVTGSQYDVSLSNGMSLSDIVTALNSELSRSTTRAVESARVLYADAGAATVATEATTLADLHHGAGQASGMTAGTVLTFSGLDRDGEPVLGTFEVVDPATQTVGDVLTGIRATLGSGAQVSLEGGRLVVRERSATASELTLNVSADIPGNAAPWGAMSVTEEGRAASGVRAEATGGELRIGRSVYGAGLGFTVGFTSGGASGSASLGLAAGTFDGADVVGTIGGEAATGTGDRLTADSGTTAAGLAIRIASQATGSLGTVTHAPGVGMGVTSILDQFLESGDGSIDALVSRIDEASRRLGDRLARGEERLEGRRARLLARFVALEGAMARAQAQTERLAAQLASLPGARDR